jgi:hypothetical protein
MTKNEQIRLTHWRFKVLQQTGDGTLFTLPSPRRA